MGNSILKWKIRFKNGKIENIMDQKWKIRKYLVSHFMDLRWCRNGKFENIMDPCFGGRS